MALQKETQDLAHVTCNGALGSMLCYAMLCYTMLCDAMLCYVMLCDAICYAMRCYAMLWRSGTAKGDTRPGTCNL